MPIKITDCLPLRSDVMCGSITQYPIVVSAQGVICEIVGPGNSMEEATASADFIVQACNNHEALLAALKLVAGSGPLNNGLRDDNTLAIVRAAIAQAEAK